ncbi:iron chaperone [Methanobacterium alcaliphilum]|uniref:iron chaperone n=1 Tax=Methanobacterium alcaliphilum TaxID=392018 RepID=UPI00200B51E9|nr:DUF1801 domain-containing protein [Methanobacterium alcaliphilum]MCK9152265.1 DUF1801 domain-containing protein [Methanobacterium alcaliphilum]
MGIRKKFSNFEEYMAEYSPDIQQRLEEIRQTVKSTVPKADEKISYSILAFSYHGILVYYGAFKNHIGFYPASNTVFDVFKDELKKYKRSKGTIQFQHKEPLPLGLIKKIVQFRAEENIAKKDGIN